MKQMTFISQQDTPLLVFESLLEVRFVFDFDFFDPGKWSRRPLVWGTARTRPAGRAVQRSCHLTKIARN
jgi:hypothetical protein